MERYFQYVWDCLWIPGASFFRKTRRQIVETAAIRWRRWNGLLAAVLSLSASSMPGSVTVKTITADDPRIFYSDYVSRDFDTESQRMRFDRLLDVEGKGYRWDSPASRASIRTNSRSVRGVLFYTNKHISKTARNPVGLYAVDGRRNEHWTFGTKNHAIERPEERVVVEFPLSADNHFHDYEVIMPYGDSVEFIGFEVESTATVESTSVRAAKKRYVAYGDSITHGFTATRVDRSYAFLLADTQDWQLINMGFGGRQSQAADGAVVGSQSADYITVFIGTNDWQQGRPPGAYQHNLRGMLKGIREKQPTVPVFLLTPLWVSPNWSPPGAKFLLAEYTQAARDLVEELIKLGDSHVHLINGSELIDHHERYFDRVLVHPNDEGFAQMAGRLSTRISDVLRTNEICDEK